VARLGNLWKLWIAMELQKLKAKSPTVSLNFDSVTLKMVVKAIVLYIR
jgi:hypothetical protein